VVAPRLAERALLVMQRNEPYVIRDVDGTPVTPAEAKAIIADPAPPFSPGAAA
jgi:hypothetical protein